MLVRETGNKFLFYGDDLTDVERWLQTTPRRWAGNSSVSNRATDNWDCGVGYDGALRLAKTGWSAGASELHAAVQALPIVGREISTGWDVAGEYPDVGRFTAGDPLHMHVRKRRPKAPVVHIVVNTVCSGATKSKAMMDFGAALVVLIDQLENSGRRVELDALSVNDGLRGGGEALVGWKVKKAQDPVDLAAIGFSIGHPAAMRRLQFAMWERCAGHTYPGSGYGKCGKLKPEHAAAIGAEDALLLDSIGTAYYSGARDMLRLAAERVNTAAGETLVELEQ